MAAEIDPVIFEFHARSAKFRSDVKQTTRTVGSDLDRMEARFRANSDRIQSSMRGLAATLATAFTGRELIGLLDSFTRLQNNLRVAGVEGQALKQVQDELFSTANKYGVELEALSSVFLKASLAQKELGVSTSDILKLNEITAAALKVTGTSAEQAKGALLQLGQALGSGTVRAEEFNSLLEGAPALAQAAADGMADMGGSVAKLRQAVVEGTVSSRQFFDAILKGGVQTLKEAEAATLTLAGGMTALTNSLTVYFGQADRSAGVSKALGLALQEIADNLDTLIPALAVIATALSGRFVAGVLGGSVALRALSAHAAIASTSLAGTALAARSAGAALLTALGGPVGAAITAVVVGLGAVAANASTADSRIASLEKSIEDTDRETALLARRLADAGVATDSLGKFAVDAEGKVLGLGNAMTEAARRTQQLVNKLRELNIYSDLQTNLGRQDEIFQELKANRAADAEFERRRNNPFAAQTRTGDAVALQASRNNSLRRELEVLKEQQASLENRAQGVRLAFENGVSLDPIPPAATPVSSKAGKGSKSDPAAEARRDAQARAAYASELEQLRADELAARAELTGSIEDRLRADLARLEADANSYARQVSLDEELSEAQRDKLVAERAEVDALERRRLLRDAEIAEIERRSNLESELANAEERVLRSQLALTDDREERARLEHAILALQHEQERAELVSLRKTRELAGAKQDEIDAIDRRIAAIDEAAKNEGRDVDRTYQSPLERYLDDLNKTDGQIRDAAERLAIEEIENLRGGLRDAISNAIGVDDPVISGLIDLLIEQLVLQPLAKGLAAAGNGGDFFGAALSSFGSLFGGFRASGGPVSGKRAYIVGEKGPELFVPPGSGNIVPNHRLVGKGAGSDPIRIEVNVVEGEIFEARVAGIADGRAVQVVRVAQPQLTEAAVSETIRRSNRRSL